MTTVSVDPDALDSTAGRLTALSGELAGVRSALRAGEVELADAVADALRSFARNSGEVLDEITKHGNGAATDLREAATCYRAMEDSLIAGWGTGRAR
jgi:hypothetical protein